VRQVLIFVKRRNRWRITMRRTVSGFTRQAEGRVGKGSKEACGDDDPWTRSRSRSGSRSSGSGSPWLAELGFGGLTWRNDPNRADLSLCSLCHLQGSSRHGGVPDTRGSLRTAQQAAPAEAGLSVMNEIFKPRKASILLASLCVGVL
jgi:hypothetical protein